MDSEESCFMTCSGDCSTCEEVVEVAGMFIVESVYITEEVVRIWELYKEEKMIAAVAVDPLSL